MNPHPPAGAARRSRSGAAASGAQLLGQIHEGDGGDEDDDEHDGGARPSSSGAGVTRGAGGLGVGSASTSTRRGSGTNAVLTRGLTTRFGPAGGAGASVASRTNARTAVPSVVRRPSQPMYSLGPAVEGATGSTADGDAGGDVGHGVHGRAHRGSRASATTLAQAAQTFVDKTAALSLSQGR